MDEEKEAFMTNIVLELIRNSGKSENALEKAIGLAQSSIKNWRNGKSKPSLEAVSKIADYFGVSVDYLLGKTDDPTPPKKSDGKPKLYVPPEYASVMVAFAGGTENLTQEDIDSIIEFIEFKKNQKKK